MIRYSVVVVLLVTGGVFLSPAVMSWVYIAGSIGFEAWLRHRLAALEREPVPSTEPPYHFSADDARLVSRCALYFHSLAVPKAGGSVLAALGADQPAARALADLQSGNHPSRAHRH